MCNLYSHKYLLFLLVMSYLMNITVNIFYVISLCAILEKKLDSEREQESCSRGRLIYAYFCNSKTFSINVFLRNLCSAKYLCLELCAYFMHTFFCSSKTFSVNMFLRKLSNMSLELSLKTVYFPGLSLTTLLMYLHN